MGCRPPGSSVHGVPRQAYWSVLPFPPPGHLSDPGIERMSPTLAGGFFTTESPGKPRRVIFLTTEHLEYAEKEKKENIKCIHLPDF